MNYLFRRSLRESLAVRGSGGGLASFEHEGVDALAPRFAREIEFSTCVCGSGDCMDGCVGVKPLLCVVQSVAVNLEALEVVVGLL